MNYLRIYYQIVASAAGRQDDVIYEKHHIVPRGLGGPDIRANIIFLTPKEHVIAHHLLAKAYPDVAKLQVGFNVKDLRRHNYSRWMLKLQNLARDLPATNNKRASLARIAKLLKILDIAGIDEILPVPHFQEKPKPAPAPAKKPRKKPAAKKPINKVKVKLTKAAKCEIRKIKAIPDEALQPQQ